MLEIYIADIRSLEQESLFVALIEEISENRKEKVLSYKNVKDRCLSLAAGLLLKEGLRKQGLSEKEITVTQNPYGKPMLPEELGIHFNLSHGADYAVCAISDEPVGIDLENITERFSGNRGVKRLELLKKKALSQEEQALLEGLEWQEQLALFTRIWTKKESFAKEDGRGMLIPFSEINTMKEIYSVDLEIKTGYWLSAYRRNPEEPEIFWVDFLEEKWQ